MGDVEDRTEKIYKYFCDYFTYTEEDLARKLSDAQLKELCLKQKCRVRMHRWNPVYDMARQLHKQGRLQKKSADATFRFLAKCVNHYKSTCLYSDEEINEARIEDWRQRKKNNLLLLDLWEYDRNNNRNFENSQVTPTRISRNMSSRLQQSIDSSYSETPLVIGENIENSQFTPPNLSINKSLSTQHLTPRKNTQNLSQSTTPTIIERRIQHIPKHLDKVNNSPGKLKLTLTQMLESQESNINTQDPTDVFMDINTESMEVNTEDCMNTGMEFLFTQETQYDEFNKSVPCTSTQNV